MKGKPSRLVVVLLAGLLAFSSVGFARAEGMGPGERGPRRGALIQGEVTTIDGAMLTVATAHRGEVSVLTDGNTRFRAKDNPDFGLDDIQVGDTLAVRGRFTRQGALMARLVALVPDALSDHARGTVTAVDGDTIAIEDKEGSAIAIVTSADTRFRVNGDADASLADIEVGMLLGAVGQFDAAGDLVARHVIAGEPRRPLKGGPVAAGTVNEASGGEFALTYPDGSTLTVTTDATTIAITRGADGPALGSVDDVREGARVVVFGVPSEDGGSLAARAILLGRARKANSRQP
jgi:hypothetical protein